MFNLENLKKTAAGNTDFVKKMIQLFIDETPSSVDTIKNSFQSQDWPNVKSAAHKIKPSFAILDINELKDEIVEIEKHANQMPNPESQEVLNTLVPKLINSFDGLIDGLKKEIETM